MYKRLLISIAVELSCHLFAIVIHPIMAGAAMVLSSLSVVFNSLRLRTVRLKEVK